MMKLMSLLAGGCCFVGSLAGSLQAADVSNGSPEYQRDLAELMMMVDGSVRETDVFQLDFQPLDFDRIVVDDRLGNSDVYHYLTFRLRNVVSDTVKPDDISRQRSAFEEVMDGIVDQYENARFETDGGLSLQVNADNLQPGERELATIVSREDLSVRMRKVRISATVTDENGTRFRLLDAKPGEGDQEAFAFKDQGQTRISSVSIRAHRAIEEKYGRRLFSQNELRGKELPPYQGGEKDDFGMATGEVYGVLIFERLPVDGDHFSVIVNGISNKMRSLVPDHEYQQVGDYVNTRVGRRAYVLQYVRIGDEYALDQKPFVLEQSAWRWVASFQPTDNRRMGAYAKYFLDNIRQSEDGRMVGVGDQSNKRVEAEFWKYYNDIRAEVADYFARKGELTDRRLERREKTYQNLIDGASHEASFFAIEERLAAWQKAAAEEQAAHQAAQQATNEGLRDFQSLLGDR